MAEAAGSRIFDEAEVFYDFIPDALWPLLRQGSGDALARVEAAGEARFFAAMVRGQIRTIRRRRADGSFYPALLADLALYWRGWRLWSAVRRRLSLPAPKPLTPPPPQTERPPP